MAMTVGDVSRLARVSVRTLHHYDDAGLLRPSERSDAGYRLYTDDDLDRLRQILYFRELGLGLDAIQALLSSPGANHREVLSVQRELLAEKVARTSAMIEAIDRELAAAEKGVQMGREEMFEVFGENDPSQYEEEVRERWGDSDEYKESARRTSRYTKQDWEEIKAESESIGTDLKTAYEGGLAPSSDEAQAAIERHYRQINDRYYTCSLALYRTLGEMYVADPRFKATYDKLSEGLAEYVRDAVGVYCDQHQG
jgi:MerR family transcriptional regulator, thiopeptide resistance regulator